MASPRKRIGELLVEAGAIDQMQLQAALGYQRQWGGKLGTTLVERGFISEPRLVEVLASQLRVPVVQIAKTRVDARALSLVPASMSEQLRIFPLELKGTDKAETLVVAMSDPTDLAAIDQLQFRTRKRIQSVLAGDRDISSAIRRHYYNEDAPPPDDDRNKAARAQPQPAAGAYGDSHLLGGDGDMVPGLVAWGEGEVARHPARPAAPQPAPMYAQQQQYYAPQQQGYATGAYPVGVPAQGMMPVGVPPGFGPDPRGRTMIAPQGAPAPQPMPARPAAPIATLDPFADLEPDVPDPLAGLDPHENIHVAPRADQIDFSHVDPLAGTSPDAWNVEIEPVGAPLGPGDPLGGHDPLGGDHDPLGGPMGSLPPVSRPPNAHDDDLEELEVDVEAIEDDHQATTFTNKKADGDAIDAAAEGWLTPTEEEEAAWETPSESDPQQGDPWEAVSENPATPEAATTDWGEATESEEAANWESPAATHETPAEAAAAASTDEWLERASHLPAPDPAAADTSSWLEPIAATVGMERPGDATEHEALELATPAEAAHEPPPVLTDGWSDDEREWNPSHAEAAPAPQEEAAPFEEAWSTTPEGTPESEESLTDWVTGEPHAEAPAPAEALEMPAGSVEETAAEWDDLAAPGAPSLSPEPVAAADDWATPSEEAAPVEAETSLDDWATPPEEPASLEAPVAAAPVEAATSWEEAPAEAEPASPDAQEWAEPAASSSELETTSPAAPEWAAAGAEPTEESAATWVETETAALEPVEQETAAEWAAAPETIASPEAAESEAAGWAAVEEQLPPETPALAEAAQEEPAAVGWAESTEEPAPAAPTEDESAAVSWAGGVETEPEASAAVEADANAAAVWAGEPVTEEPPAADADAGSEATAWAESVPEEAPHAAEAEAAAWAAAEEAVAAAEPEAPAVDEAAAWASPDERVVETDTQVEAATEVETSEWEGEQPITHEEVAHEELAVSPEPVAEEPLPAEEPAADVHASESAPAEHAPADDEWAGFGFAEPAPETEAEAAPPAAVEEHPAVEVVHPAETTPAEEGLPLVPTEPLHEPSAPEAPLPAMAAAQRGWSLVGIEHPTAADAIRTVGVLLDLLIAQGSLDVAAFQAALREAEERARS